MLWKKTRWFWKSGFAIISFILVLGVSGCTVVPEEETEIQEDENVALDIEDDADEMKDICLDLYEKASEENKLADLETIRSIVNRFGEYGYSAIDSKNQVDMTMAEQIVLFCDAVEQKKVAETIVFQIDYFGGFIKYDLKTEDGNVEVTKSYYVYEDKEIQRKSVSSYLAKKWDYTAEGYMMFSGSYYSETLYALTLSAEEDYVALRVEPLAEKYRELNRKYLLPIGYACNNMFITDWNESDFGDLNFYDLFDIFYSEVYKSPFSYMPDDNLGVRAVYHIPKEDFEHVIQTYFNIDSKTLQSKTVYCQEDSTYEYKPRGFEEVEYPEYPYPEVIGYTENNDSTITLMAQVVFPYKGDSNVYAHEVTVRPLDNGGVQYVSNKIIPSEDNGEVSWHTPRLTEDEWEELYGGQ